MNETGNKCDCGPSHESLPASQSFLNSIIDQSPYPMWISDENGTLVKINKACTDLLNISADEVMGVYNIFNDSIVEEQGLMPLIRRVFDAGESVNFELRYDSSQLKHLQLRQYAFVILDVTAFPIMDSNQKITHAVIQHIDITSRKQSEEALHNTLAELELRVQERTAELSAANATLVCKITEQKQTEMELRKSEEKFSTAFRASPDSISINRLSDGMYLEVNDGFATVTGYVAEDVIGRTSLELNNWVNPDDRTRLVNELKARGVIANLEAQFRRKDGVISTGLMSARIIEVGGEACVLSITRDISDRKRAEEYLRESEINLRMLMDSMPVGVWWFDRDGNVGYLNRYFMEHFGYTTDDIPTLDDWYLQAYPDPDYRSAYIAARNAAISEALKSGTPVPPQEAKIVCRNGAKRHIIINTQFALGRTVGIFTDITEREIFHEHLQKMDKLESLGVLAGGIAHDFNNILTGIIGNISFARTLLDQSDKPAAILQSAEKAANRAADLAHQLLTFAKGGQPIKKIISIRHILEESASFVLSGSNVSCDMEIPDDLAALEVDEGQISQVINNLIINASQAMPAGGTITIRGENIRVDAVNIMSLVPGDYIRITITDTGSGISEEDQKKIFDPYFTTKISGSGLGLASAHSIVSKHEGAISVNSVVGKGTTFELLLPASDKRAMPDEIDTALAGFDRKDGHSVLVMDDDEIIREMISLMLDELGYRVQTCASGEEAIDLYKSARDSGSPYSAVIMDLTVPGGMGGKEAARHILAIDPDARLIVSSGYSTDPIMSEYDKFGFRETLLKPYTLDVIIKALGSVLP